MKTLLVLRHAKASLESGTGNDFDRPLSGRGRQAAQAIGLAMRNRGWKPDAIVTSPAARAVETLAGVEEGFGAELERTYDPRIYDAAIASLLEVIRQTDDHVDRLLLVGHNPGLQMLLLQLAAKDDQGVRDRVAVKYPTAALVELLLPVENWRDVGAGSGRIASLVVPRELD